MYENAQIVNVNALFALFSTFNIAQLSPLDTDTKLVVNYSKIYFT